MQHSCIKVFKIVSSTCTSLISRSFLYKPLPAFPRPYKQMTSKQTIEEIYQKKSQHEHILARPDSYVGSTNKNETRIYVYDETANKIVQKDIKFAPALYKIFDEILVNAADNKIRDATMDCIRIDINKEENKIKIWNNGSGIPVVLHKEEKILVPTMIFGHLLTSSNYDDSEKKMTGGRNGFGAKLCNIFSTKFIVETSSAKSKKAFQQIWTNNMTEAQEPKTKPSSGKDFTCITFHPDLSRFGMTELEDDIVQLFKRRAFDVAATCHGVKVFLNGNLLNIKSFKDYVELYVKSDESDLLPKIVHERISPRWEVALVLSSDGFQQVSFVNSIATTKGGTHIDYVCDKVTTKLLESAKKKAGSKSSIALKSYHIKSHLKIFVNCLIENPTFDSQTKEFLTLPAKSFGSKCELSEKFHSGAAKCGVLDNVMSWIKFKAMEKMDKQCHKSKHTKLKGIPKLDDANEAGSKSSHNCTLILTEGDSAKSLAIAGLSVIGRDKFGVFPLRGKLLNVREAPMKQIMANAEINNLLKIIGLQYKSKYDTEESMKTLRYGKLMIMTDQDQDGSHIKGLIINFIHNNWPNLLKRNFIQEFITPIVKVTKGVTQKSFYSLPEFESWLKETPQSHTWKVKYYKGLGTSSSKEAKEYFTEIDRHKIPFVYSGPEDDKSIVLAFGKSADERKDWLKSWMLKRKRNIELGLPEEYLYGEKTTSLTYNDFIHKELVLFSNMDNERSIPSIVDGLKPGQRKVLFTCFKRNLVRELKVAQLAGSVAELSSYHHGEQSLMGTIIGLAHDFVGSNNVNLLMPNGQFGTRLNGGKDAASPRYIHTCLNPITRLIFHPDDDPLLHYLKDDGRQIEPLYYMPIVPMVLINGAEGIGTGWSSKICNHNLLDIIHALRCKLEDKESPKLTPSYRGFTGEIFELDPDKRFVTFGEISILDDNQVEITELPVKTWTQNYKETVLEVMMNGSDKTQACIVDYKEYHTDQSVKFVVRLTKDQLHKAETIGLHKFFKLSTQISLNSMVLFDQHQCITKYESANQILDDFFAIRMDYYAKRKSYLESKILAEVDKLDNQVRFLLEKIEGKLKIENRSKKELIKLLHDSGYKSDPLKACKSTLKFSQGIELTEGDDEVAEEEETNYEYILGMPLWSLSLEKKNELIEAQKRKHQELSLLQSKSIKQLYLNDLCAIEKSYRQILEDDRLELKMAHDKAKSKTTGKGRGKKSRLDVSSETLPSEDGVRVMPIIDSEMKNKVIKDKITLTKKKANNSSANVAGEEIEEDEFDVDIKAPLAKRLAANGFSLGESSESKAVPKAKATPKKNKTPVPSVGKVARGRGKKLVVKDKRDPWEMTSDEESIASYKSELSFADLDADEEDLEYKPTPSKRRSRVDLEDSGIGNSSLNDSTFDLMAEDNEPITCSTPVKSAKVSATTSSSVTKKQGPVLAKSKVYDIDNSKEMEDPDVSMKSPRKKAGKKRSIEMDEEISE